MIFNIRNLLTLFIGEPISPKIIIALGDIITLKSGGENKERIEILYGQTDKDSKEGISPHKMYILLPNIRKDIEKIFNKWSERYLELKSPYDSFFSTFYNPSMYIEFHFLSLMQAIESYHRVIRGGKYMPDENYSNCKEELIKAIPNYINKDHRESLKSRIKYGNEYSLRKRLKDIIDSFNSYIIDLLSINRDIFINKVVDTCNYLTHYDKELKDKSLTGVSLYYINFKLKSMITILILREIGINETDIIKALEQNRKFKQLIKDTDN